MVYLSVSSTRFHMKYPYFILEFCNFLNFWPFVLTLIFCSNNWHFCQHGTSQVILLYPLFSNLSLALSFSRRHTLKKKRVILTTLLLNHYKKENYFSWKQPMNYISQAFLCLLNNLYKFKSREPAPGIIHNFLPLTTIKVIFI